MAEPTTVAHHLANMCRMSGRTQDKCPIPALPNPALTDQVGWPMGVLGVQPRTHRCRSYRLGRLPGRQAARSACTPLVERAHRHPRGTQTRRARSQAVRHNRLHLAACITLITDFSYLPTD
jgi:hypothetical protein